MRKTLPVVVGTAALLSALLMAPSAHAATTPTVPGEKIACGQNKIKVVSGAVMRVPFAVTNPNAKPIEDEDGDPVLDEYGDPVYSESPVIYINTYADAVKYRTGKYTAGQKLGKRAIYREMYVAAKKSRINFGGNVYTVPAKGTFITKCYGRSATSKNYLPSLSVVPGFHKSLTVSVKTSKKKPGAFQTSHLLANPKSFTSQTITLTVTGKKSTARSGKTLTITPRVNSNKKTAGKCFYPREGSVDYKGRTKVIKK